MNPFYKMFQNQQNVYQQINNMNNNMPKNNPNGMGINQQNMYQYFNIMNNNKPQNNMKGMGNNPIFFQQFMNNQNFMNLSQNNNNYQQMFLQWKNNINNFNNRNNQTLNMNNDGKNNNLKNIIFKDSSRGAIKFVVSGSVTMENLLHLYGRKIGKEGALGRDFIFIYDCSLIHLNDQRTLDEFFFTNINIITVIETNFIAGGKKFNN